MVAGTRSGCGKTSVSLGLMAALKRKGLVVQPFKSGPDFIDPGHHHAAAKRTSHNLDGWMVGKAAVRDIFHRACRGADVAVVEGAMGLFDGFSGLSDAGSGAELARWLDIPVLLVADVKGMARSAAAMVKGYAGFDPKLKFAGAVFNQVASVRHKELLTEAMAESSTPLLGCLGRREAIAAPSRHLGLVMADEMSAQAWSQRTEALADWIDEGLDLDNLLNYLPEIYSRESEPLPSPALVSRRIGLARDRAFCFYYEENLRLLRQSGAELVELSPMEDAHLPPGLDGLYLGGGYPELYANELAKNTAMRRAVKKFAQNGNPVYAECGGLMYLAKELKDISGTAHPMAGVFDFSCQMGKKLRALGYREITLAHDSPLGPKGTRFRGHEFHYSGLQRQDPEARNIYQATDRTGANKQAMGFFKHNTLASYVHLHFASNPKASGGILCCGSGE